ncbi:hypothetical protein [Halovivax cerinus]|uniref:Uncharacterized protein n=1 Tax=Halovivax cerinus TaxID=1487865 RepID=A0ABD5NKE9_9EURY|nr:hypothetical protein [Halovivax cerinus]
MEPIDTFDRPIPFDESFAATFDPEEATEPVSVISNQEYDVVYVESDTAGAYVRRYNNTDWTERRYARYRTTYELSVLLGGSAPAHAFGDKWIASRACCAPDGAHEHDFRTIEMSPDEYIRQLAKHIVLSDIDRTLTNTITENGWIYFIDQEPISNWDRHERVSSLISRIENTYDNISRRSGWSQKHSFRNRLGVELHDIATNISTSDTFQSALDELASRSEVYAETVAYRRTNIDRILADRVPGIEIGRTLSESGTWSLL